MKTECREIAAHFLNLFLANFEAIGAVGNYIHETADMEEVEMYLDELSKEGLYLQDEKLLTPAESAEIDDQVRSTRDALIEENYAEVKEALDQIGKKAFNKMFESVVICECGDPGIPEPRKGGRN